MAKKKKYYVVWQGNQPGIYESWTEAKLQIQGYPNAKYKAFSSREAAEGAFYDSYDDHVSISKKKAPSKSSDAGPETHPEIVWDSISVDAACSGNPGRMEYQGVDTRSGDQIFHQAFELGTNNIGEFLALVHALALLHRQGKDTPVYSDSRIAIGWVKKKQCRTKLSRNRRTARLFDLVDRAEAWLKTHTYPNKILKWDTKNWGEIPADFGRK